MNKNSILYKAIRIVVIVVIFWALVYVFYKHGRWAYYPIYRRYFTYSVEDRVKQYGKEAKSRFMPFFSKVKVDYPPTELGLVILKKERKFEVWAREKDKPDMVFVKEYPMTAFCGKLGPKLKEGDWQIPEGIYEISGLNPNSSYHLSLKVNYPNDFDKKMGKADKRTNLGGLIFIHGYNVTIGCVPIGNPAIEEVFVMVAETGRKNVEVVMSPLDFRLKADKYKVENVHYLPLKPPWVSILYKSISEKLNLRYAKNR